MDNKKEYYLYKIPAEKHREYVRQYDLQHKKERHERYVKFKAMQDMYYKRYAQYNEPIPYKYLKQKDKRLYNKQPENFVKRVISGIFGGKKK